LVCIPIVCFTTAGKIIGGRSNYRELIPAKGRVLVEASVLSGQLRSIRLSVDVRTSAGEVTDDHHRFTLPCGPRQLNIERAGQ
jgi:hypothetical protein